MLTEALEKMSVLDKMKVFELFNQAEIEGADLAFWSDLEHGPEDSYGRNIVALGECFELMVVTWLPGDFSMIHNHGDASWGAVQVFGELTHRSYQVVDRHLSLLGEGKLNSGELITISNRLIHQMGNDMNQPVYSLHFYWNDQPSTSITANTLLYDVVNGVVQTVEGGAFYGLTDDQIIASENGLTADEEIRKSEERLYNHRIQQITA